ncbi:hypothetical protein SAMN04488103_101360 [Gemmobacter aquatilis]|uniref:Uncharacterized protein n=1 Tax=Gemmobacter aquatilis TaxID=933059 RepID=A0A1H7Z023_9RHOB|nr:hypothetical protein [Gemmobacter aquatilis]SEM51565.1 hypothetical protein SAMN04488103_101360 [Gemmobacter aquatilis]
MIAAPEARLFAALAQAAEAALGADHAATRAALRAATDPAPEHGAALQAALDALPAATRDGLLATAHRQMREDISAIWGLLPGAALGGGMH